MKSYYVIWSFFVTSKPHTEAKVHFFVPKLDWIKLFLEKEPLITKWQNWIFWQKLNFWNSVLGRLVACAW